MAPTLNQNNLAKLVYMRLEHTMCSELPADAFYRKAALITDVPPLIHPPGALDGPMSWSGMAPQ